MWKQGDTVRMIAAPAPCFAPFVGWKFTVVRASWRQINVRLRADYAHTGGHIIEMLYTPLLRDGHFTPPQQEAR